MFVIMIRVPYIFFQDCMVAIFCIKLNFFIIDHVEEEFERRVKKSRGSVGYSKQTTKDWTKTIGTKRAVKHGSQKFHGMEGDAKYTSLSVQSEDLTDDSFENEVCCNAITIEKFLYTVRAPALATLG